MIKAGSAGSNPDGVTTTDEATSHPLHLLLREIGDAAAHLNTIVVGLDAVEKGHSKPDTLDISWNPDDRKAAARQSRKFVVEAVFVRVSEAMLEYVLALAQLPRLRNASSSWNGDTKNARKVSDILTAALGDDYRIAAIVLLVHWRNRIVHKNSNAKLNSEQKAALQTNEDAIAKDYKGLSVDCLLCHFEEKRPTLKDISSLIAMCINVARKIDKTIYNNLSKDDLESWLEYYGLQPRIERIKQQTKAEKQEASVHRLFLSEAPNLYEAYRKHASSS